MKKGVLASILRMTEDDSISSYCSLLLLLSSSVTMEVEEEDQSIALSVCAHSKSKLSTTTNIHSRIGCCCCCIPERPISPTKKPQKKEKTKTEPNQTNKGTAASNKQSTGEIQRVDNSNHTQFELLLGLQQLKKQCSKHADTRHSA